MIMMSFFISQTGSALLHEADMNKPIGISANFNMTIFHKRRVNETFVKRQEAITKVSAHML